MIYLWRILHLISVSFMVSIGFRANGSELTYERLKQDIRSHDLASADAFLRFLATDPAYRQMQKSSVLERRSGALHDEEVSAAFPRIVMGDGNLSLHLTADPSRLGHNLIEIIEYVPALGEFKFHLVNFALRGTKDLFFDDPTGLNSDTAEFDRLMDLYGKTTGGTLARCDSCHLSGYMISPREDLAQNWGPGISNFRVYGGVDGRISKGSEEAKDFEKFRKTLADPLAGTLYRAMGVNFSTDVTGDIVFPDHPLEALDRHVVNLARRRAAAKLKEFSKYPRFSYAIVGALLNCPNLPDFFTDNSRVVHEARLRTMLNRPESPMIPVLGIRHDEVDSHFWTQYQEGSAKAEVSERDFLRASTVPFMQAISVEIRAAIELNGRADAPYLTDDQKSSSERGQAEFLNPQYIQRLTNLKYLLRGYYPEVPSEIYSFFNEVTQEQEMDASGKSATVLFAGSSFRIDGATTFLEQLLSEDLGPGFLTANPELNLFRDGALRGSQLTVPLSDYCERLKKTSQGAFKIAPLT